MSMKNWEEKIRQDYGSILGEEQIEATIVYWRKVLVAQREEIVRELESCLGKDFEEDKIVEYWQDFPRTKQELEWAKGGIRFAKNVAISIVKKVGEK